MRIGNTAALGSSRGMLIAPSVRQKSLRKLTESLQRVRFLPCAKCRSRRHTLLMPKADVVAHGTMCPCLTQLAQLLFRLLQPVRHVHFAVHRHRGREVLLGLLAIAHAAVKFAETEVAVGDKRAHAAGLG